MRKIDKLDLERGFVISSCVNAKLTHNNITAEYFCLLSSMYFSIDSVEMKANNVNMSVGKCKATT